MAEANATLENLPAAINTAENHYGQRLMMQKKQEKAQEQSMTAASAITNHVSSSSKKRVVILPGPHKTGTTSVQSFLVSLTKKNLLGDWEWPASSSKAFSGVAHSVLFNSDDKHNFLKKKKAKINAAWKKNNHSVVLGAELFDYVAATPPEHLPSVFQRLQTIFPEDVEDMTAVVMYRTPRSSHLVSAWKQQIAMAKRAGGGQVWRNKIERKSGEKKGKAPSLAEFLCHGQWKGHTEFNVDKIVAAQINPMGVANAFLRYGNMSVTVGDMSNMTDIPSTIVCEVLGIPCNEKGKVIGLNKTKPKVLNQRENPVELRLSAKDMNEVENVLRRMDCFYYCDLRENVTILHEKDEMFTGEQGWKDCCESPEMFLSPVEAYEKLKNIGCRASGLPETTARSSLRMADFMDMKSIVFDDDGDSVDFPLLNLVFPFLAMVLLLHFQRRRKRSM